MQDLTTGPITRHLLKTTGFMLVTMLFQTLYFLIDLYWVGRLSTAAVAAVGIAGNLTFIVLALTQMLGVGTTAVISHAVGRKDAPEAVMLFNQAQVLAMVTGALFLVIGLVTRLPYSRGMEAHARHRAAERRGIRHYDGVSRPGLLDHPAVRRRGAGRIRHRHAHHPGGVHARRRAGVLRRSRGRPELRRAPGATREGHH